VTSIPPCRTVLAVEDEQSIRHVLRILRSGLSSDDETGVRSRKTLAELSRDSFDAILLDLRCANLPTNEAPPHLKPSVREVRPRLVGRILILASEVSDLETMNMIECRCLRRATRNRALKDLWDRLRPVLGASKAPETIP
jgi:DNA-binding response OmpR family regulator